ncbi:MAG: hypothetical protein MUC81_08905 [Bacteroidia bacterium]|jgi:hypothetical protein|nr:hypothetical protein [Bacteroidia bacterium]
MNAAPWGLIFFAIENQIYQLVCQYYEITEEEIKIIEGELIQPRRGKIKIEK